MELIDQSYRIQQSELLDLCQKYDTPFYLYDGDAIASQFSRLTAAFDVPKLKIHYACKALTNLAILELLRSLGAGLDAVSIQEVLLGLEAGFTPEDIIYTPNSVSIEEFEKAFQLGVKVNVDSIDVLEYMGVHHPHIPLCIRINPHIMGGGNQKISVGHIDSKFGISIHQMPLVERLVDTLDIRIEGIHMHTGSDILDADVFLRAAEILLEVAAKFSDLKYVDFGSGFKVKYKALDLETDIEQLGSKLSERLLAFNKAQGKEIELKFEPGKFLVSESGYFLTKVNQIKQTTSTVFVGIDSGFNHFLRPMFYDAYHEVTNISNPGGPHKIYTVVGYICETDTFGWNRKINEVSRGDILAFRNAGAYCFSMASNYNSRFRPAEVLLYQGKDYLIRRRETMEDLIRNQVRIDKF